MDNYKNWTHCSRRPPTKKGYFGVECNGGGAACNKCGWNPEVERQRIKKIREMRAKTRTLEIGPAQSVVWVTREGV